MTTDTPPWTEEERLAALRSYDLLDTRPERAFDDFVRLAKIICDAPVALISLVDRDRQWFKAVDGVDLRETPIEQSVCAHAIRQPDVFVVRDTTADPRFRDNPLVTGDHHLRFYAGAPLVTQAGLPLGTLCVLDNRARPLGLTQAQTESLAALARQVMTQVELRRALDERAQTEAALTSAHNRIRDVLASIDDPFYVIDTDWRVTYGNERFFTQLGRPPAEVIGCDLLTLFPDIDGLRETDGIRLVAQVMSERQSVRSELYSHAIGAWCEVSVYPLSDGGVTVYIQNIEARKKLEQALSGALATVSDALAEKELLMLEVHHRVKNSLQMVQSLLTLQARRIEDPAVARQLQESAARVRTFGALHETLYQVADGAQVDLASYLAKLVLDLNAGIGATLPGRPIVLEVKATLWPSSDVSTLGLVLTELVTNALKYGAGQVTVRFSTDADGAARLSVCDEGSGLAADFDPAQVGGLGMRLVTRLLRERGGSLTLDRSQPNTCFSVNLPAQVLGQVASFSDEKEAKRLS